jgi:hypothetical protein
MARCRCSRGSPLPAVAVMFLVTLLSAAETYFVSSLGTDAIAAASLVVPVILLMTMVSIGGIGGGLSSAIARAHGRKGVAVRWSGRCGAPPVDIGRPRLGGALSNSCEL